MNIDAWPVWLQLVAVLPCLPGAALVFWTPKSDTEKRVASASLVYGFVFYLIAGWGRISPLWYFAAACVIFGVGVALVLRLRHP